MKKLFVFLLLGVFMISLASAFEFDNTLRYENNDMKVTIENAFGLPFFGSDLGTVELKSHKSVDEVLKVAPGNNIVVMYYDFNFSEVYKDGLGDVEFVNMSDGEEIEKDYHFVIWDTIIEEKNNYSKVCSEVQNGTNISTVCEQVFEGTYQIEREGWVEFNTRDIPKGKARIGLATNVNLGETIDGVWTIAGKKVERHAVWTADLNVGLVSYYKLDDNLATTIVIDSIGNSNGGASAFTSDLSAAGLINLSFDLDGGNDDINTNFAPNINPSTTEYSISIWAKAIDKGSTNVVWGTNLGSDQRFYLGADGSTDKWVLILGGVNKLFSIDTIDFGNWVHLVITTDGLGDAELFVNEVSQGTIGTTSYTTTGNLILGDVGSDGSNFLGELDEIGIWNKTLTQSEITQLYNDGNGITWIDQFFKIITTLNKPENNTVQNDATVDFNWTIIPLGLNITNWTLNVLFVNGTLAHQHINTTINTNQTITVIHNDTLFLDESYIWTVESCGTDGINDTCDLTNNFTFTLDTAPPVVNITFPPEGFIVISPLQNITLNYTVVHPVGDLSNCFFNTTSNSTPTSINCTANTTSLLYPIDNPDNLTIYVFANDTAANFGVDNVTIFKDTVAPQINITSPIGVIEFGEVGENETLNVTFTDTNLESCWYDYNGTNITIEGCLTGIKNSTQFILEADNLNITLYANDTLGNTNSSFINWSYNLLVNSINFSEQARSGTLENFTINVIIADKFTGVSMFLNYNGVNNSMTSTSSNHTRTYTTQLIVPAVLVDTNIILFFITTLSEGEVVTIISTDEENQTVSPFLIDDCSVFTKTLLSFEMVDEDSLNEINGTIEIALDIFSIGTTQLVNTFNTSFNYIIGEDSKICLENITEDYSMSYQIRHFGDETQYFKKYRNVQLLTINNDTISQNITLYNLNLSRGNSFNVIVVGNLLSSQGNSGLLVDTQRQYLATNEFVSVESPITDSSGVAIANLVETEEIYNFLISFNGELLGTFNNFQVKCVNAALGQCSITLNLATATGGPTDFETFGNITQVFLLDTNTNILHHTFSSTDGTSKTVRSLVIKNDGYANETICDSSTSGTSGTILCPITVAFQNVSICVQTFVDGQEQTIGTKCFTQGPDVNWQGADILIMLLMFSSITLLFLAHPITIIIGAILGLAIPVIFITSAEASLGVLFGAVLFYIAAGIVAIIVIAKKKN